MKDKNKSLIVTKANNLNEARYKLSTSEQRIILTMTSKIQPGDKDFQLYWFKISEFLDFLEIKNEKAYSEIKTITEELMKKVLKIPTETGLIQVNWLSSAEYYDGEGIVELEFSPKLKPYLLQLKECFVSYNLENVIHLKHSYSIRIYELLKQYEKIGTRTFELAELKKILGIAPDKYKHYNGFKRKVLLPAYKELPLKTDITFEIKELKVRCKVIALSFTIIRKPGIIKDNKKKKCKHFVIMGYDEVI